MNARSVGESSTTMIFLMAICASSPLGFVLVAALRDALLREMGLDRLQQAFLREGLREVFVGSDHAATRAVETAVLGRERAPRRRPVLAALLDERAGLVAVEARHHDVDE